MSRSDADNKRRADQRLLKKLQLEKLKQQRDMLPHLYGFPHYSWSREFYESRNKVTILCAGNQISKSSTQIRKAIHWATATHLWPELWPSNPTPRQFWYLYPSKDVSTAEFETKWEPEFMPRGEMKDHPQYGWTAKYEAKKIHSIEFNSGVRIYFKHYSQDTSRLQSGTCSALGTLILTPTGLVPVQHLLAGDCVVTRDGLKQVVNTFQSVQTTVQKTFYNGKDTRFTLDHPFWTTSGWQEFLAITKGSIGLCVKNWNTLEWLSTVARSFTGVRTLSIATIEITTSIGKKDCYIGKCIKTFIILRKYQKGITSIIKTVITSIILPLILNLSNIEHTQNFTQRRVLRTSNTLISILEKIQSRLRRTVEKLLPPDGKLSTMLRARHVAMYSGIQKVLSTALKNVSLFQDLKIERTIVLFAKMITKQVGRIRNSALTLVPQKTEKLRSRREIVYNIEVEGKPEYFANGVLVHNCHAIFTDEELPVALFDELNFRLSATDGYFGMVFTATIGQEYWFKAIERRGQKDEVLKTALKLQISRWDCLKYEEGFEQFPTPWTPEKIREAEDKCSTPNEIEKRINGRFVMDEGLKYPSFNKQNNVVKPYPELIEKDNWYIYSGTDIGSGGKAGHPAAIVFIAVRQDFQKACVFKGWKSPKGKDITSVDILEKYQQLRGNMTTICAYYDWAASDFKVHANRLGESFEKAEKSHDIGEDTLNSLFKHNMLDIFDIEELEDLSWEFDYLLQDTPKRSAKDDFIDGLRYAVTKIPWDWTACGSEYKEYIAEKAKLTPDAQEIEDRRSYHFPAEEDVDTILEEIDYYNELYDA